MTDHIIEQIRKNKRLIFTVTTGRSGTGYLADILGRLPNVRAEHEGEPSFASCLREANGNSETARKFLLESKLPHINSTEGNIFIETSHLFCKGFLEPLLKLGIVPDIIALHRNEREVAKSLWQLNTIPGRSKTGLLFLINPDDNVFVKVPNWQELSDYELCFWYCLEIKERVKYYTKLILENGGRVANANFHEIQNKEGIEKLVGDLSLPEFPLIEKTKLLLSKPKPVNQKKQSKREWNLEADVEKSEERVLNCISK